MAGFGDLPVGDGTLFAQTAAPSPAPVTATPAPSSGGLLGAIYNHIVAPTVHAVGGGLSDIPKIGSAALNLNKAAYKGLAGEVTGNKNLKQSAAADLNKAGAAASSSNFAKNYEDPNLEKAAGKSTSQVLDVLAPVVGSAEFAGKEGLGQLIKAGAKVGAKFGSVGGVAGAAANGGSGQQLFSGGVEGGALGGAAGAAGGVLGAGLGKVAGRLTPASADEAGAGASAASGNQGKASGLFPNASAKAGARAAQADKVAQATDFAGASKGDIAGTLSYDKGGNPVGLTQVSSFLRGLDMPAHAQSMENASNFMNGSIGGHLSDITDNVPVNVGSPADVGRTSIISKVGTLDGLTKSGAGAAGSTLRQIRSATDNLGTDSKVSDVLHSISQLESAKSDLGQAVSMGNPAAKSQVGAYQDVIDHLHTALNSSGVNKAVSAFKVGPEEEATIRQDAVDSGVSPKMGQHVIDTLNNAKSYGDLRSAMQPAVVAGKLSRVAKETFSNAVPQAGKNGSLGIPSWELAMSLHNPAYLAAAGARLATHTGIVDRALSKINPGAFKTAETAGLAPDEVTAQKLAQPGGGPVSTPPAGGPTVTAGTAPTPGVVSRAAGAVGDALGSPSVVGAAAGQGANQLGQGVAQPGAPTGTQSSDGGIDTSSIDAALNGAGGDTSSTLDTSTVPGGTLQDLEQEIAADPKNASVYQEIYDDAQKEAAASGPQKLNATEAKNLTNIQNATAALSNYVTGLNSLGSATRGAGVGKLSSLLGHLGIGGDNAKTAARLESSKEELAIQLAQAMNNGTKPQGAQIDQIKAMLPSVNDPKNLATAKIEQLSQNLSDYLKIATNASVASRTSGNTSDLLSQLTGGQ